MTLSDIPAPSRWYICLWLVSLMRGGYKRAYASLRKDPLSEPESHCATGVGCDLLVQDHPDYYEWAGHGIYPGDENLWDNGGSNVEPLGSITALMGWKYEVSERLWNEYVEDVDETVAGFLRDKGDSPVNAYSIASHIAQTSDTGLDFEHMAFLMRQVYVDELDFDIPTAIFDKLIVDDPELSPVEYIEFLGVEPHQGAHSSRSYEQALSLP